jgi:hypothetical protein
MLANISYDRYWVEASTALAATGSIAASRYMPYRRRATITI